jgi:hypothetical protein
MNANELVEPQLRARGPAGAPQLRALDVLDPAELEGPSARLATLVRSVARRIRRRPFASLVLALGIGFVIGGALSLRTGRTALAVAARHVTRELLKQVL